MKLDLNPYVCWGRRPVSGSATCHGGTWRCGPWCWSGTRARRRSGWSSCGGTLDTETDHSGSLRVRAPAGGNSYRTGLQRTTRTQRWEKATMEIISRVKSESHCSCWWRSIFAASRLCSAASHAFVVFKHCGGDIHTPSFHMLPPPAALRASAQFALLEHRFPLILCCNCITIHNSWILKCHNQHMSVIF